MKITVSYDYIAPWGHEWAAYFDDLHPDGPYGDGGNPAEALGELLWMVDDKPELEAAVAAKLAQVNMEHRHARA